MAKQSWASDAPGASYVAEALVRDSIVDQSNAIAGNRRDSQVRVSSWRRGWHLVSTSCQIRGSRLRRARWPSWRLPPSTAPLDRDEINRALRVFAIAKNRDLSQTLPDMSLFTDDQLVQMVEALVRGNQLGR